jgi:RNA polymerase subunit RPABC4/transcription elongation factor Spt4
MLWMSTNDRKVQRDWSGWVVTIGPKKTYASKRFDCEGRKQQVD